MPKSTAFLTFALAGALCGCAGMNSEPKSSYDRIAGVKINETKLNDLPMAFLENFSMTFDMRQEINSASATNYFLVVGCLSLDNTVFSPNFQNSILVLADEDRFAFSQFNGSHGRLYYPTTAETLRKIANAKNVEVRFTDIRGRSIDKKLAPKNRSNLKQFADKYLIP